MKSSEAARGCGPAAEWDTPRSNSTRTLGGLPTTEMRPSEEDEEGTCCKSSDGDGETRSRFGCGKAGTLLVTPEEGLLPLMVSRQLLLDEISFHGNARHAPAL